MYLSFGRAFRPEPAEVIQSGGEWSNKMNNLREFTENTISLAKSKAEEDIVISQGLLVLIAAAAFIIGLIMGILCTSGSKAKKKRKVRKSSFDADEYARQLNFDSFDDFDGGSDDSSFEYAL